MSSYDDHDDYDGQDCYDDYDGHEDENDCSDYHEENFDKATPNPPHLQPKVILWWSWWLFDHFWGGSCVGFLGLFGPKGALESQKQMHLYDKESAYGSIWF